MFQSHPYVTCIILPILLQSIHYAHETNVPRKLIKIPTIFVNLLHLVIFFVVDMKVFLLLLILSQICIAASHYKCNEEGYTKYLAQYPSKCGYDLANCNTYYLCLTVICRDHYSFWERACLDIERKAYYRSYPMSFSILSDFSDEDLDKQMTLGVTYSGEGSFAEPVDDVPVSWSGNIVSRDLCIEAEEYSISHPKATSWASDLIIAAETALKRANIKENLYLPYIIKCLPESQKVEPNDVTPADIIGFVTEKGLMSETVGNSIFNKDELCSAMAPKFYFDVTRNDIPNKSGLMKFAAEGDPVDEVCCRGRSSDRADGS